jgi:hypothetical protein
VVREPDSGVQSANAVLAAPKSNFFGYKYGQLTSVGKGRVLYFVLSTILGLLAVLAIWIVVQMVALRMFLPPWIGIGEIIITAIVSISVAGYGYWDVLKTERLDDDGPAAFALLVSWPALAVVLSTMFIAVKLTDVPEWAEGWGEVVRFIFALLALMASLWVAGRLHVNTVAREGSMLIADEQATKQFEKVQADEEEIDPRLLAAVRKMQEPAQ